MITVLKYLFFVVCGLCAAWLLFFLCCWLILLVLSLTISMKKEYTVPSRFYGKVMNFGYWVLCKNGRVRIHCSGVQKIPENTRFLLVSNHRSKFDNMIQSLVLRKEQISYISKKENFSIPIGRHFMKRICYLSLDRGNMKSAVKVIIDAVNLIKNDYCSVAVFPEGTRSLDCRLGELKPGIFKIAQKAGCPVVVGVTTGTENIHKNWPWKPTHVHFDIVEVIPVEDIANSSTVEIAERVRNTMLHNLHDQPEETVLEKKEVV